MSAVRPLGCGQIVVTEIQPDRTRITARRSSCDSLGISLAESSGAVATSTDGGARSHLANAATALPTRPRIGPRLANCEKPTGHQCPRRAPLAWRLASTHMPPVKSTLGVRGSVRGNRCSSSGAGMILGRRVTTMPFGSQDVAAPQPETGMHVLVPGRSEGHRGSIRDAPLLRCFDVLRRRSATRNLQLLVVGEEAVAVEAAQLLECLVLDLADTLPADLELLADLG